MLRNSRCTFVCCATVCLFWIAGYTPPVNAQNQQPNASADVWHFQFDLFQLLLEEQGLSRIVGLDDAFATPREAVVVIVGPTAVAPSLSDQMLRFVRAGGTLLLASDSELRLRGIGRFMRGPVTANYAKDRYSIYPDCVSVTDITNSGFKFNDVLKLITNRSTWFLPETWERLEWETIARFPRDCMPETSHEKPLLALGRPARTGPARNAMNGNAGMIMVSADASLFTNGMLWYGDNAVLAIRTSSLLCPPGKSRLAFMADGQLMGSARQRLQPPPANQASEPQIPPTPKPDLAQLLKLVNAVAKEVGDSSVLNESLRQRPRNVPPKSYFQALLVLILTGALLWAVWKLLVSGPLRPILLRHRTMRSAYELRAVGGDQAGDYRQSAGYLAREFCWELTGSRSSADWQKAAAQLLTAKRSGTVDDPSELIRIIDIASRGRHERMSAVHFQQLGQTIAALRAKQLQAKQIPAQPATVQ